MAQMVNSKTSFCAQNKTPQTQSESWDVCRSALPQVLLNNNSNPDPSSGKWLSRAKA